jgi:cysteine desulfurase
MVKPDPYYFDYSASAPPFEKALEQIISYSLKYPANPSSVHSSGKEASQKLVELKIQFCNLLDCKDGHLLLCSSATEANNTIIEGHRRKFPEGRILIAEDVHDSIWYASRRHKDHTDYLALNEMNDLSPEKLVRAIRSETSLICINQVCNETGRIHALKPVAEFCSVRNIRLLVDGSQALGHIPVNLDHIPCNYYSFSAHKFGGPRAVGGLVIRDRQFEPLLSGGKQEWELRAGTENLAGLGAAITALGICLSDMEEEVSRLDKLKTNLLLELKSKIPEMLINTPDVSRPGFLSLSFPGFQGNEIVTALSLSGFKIAMGSACHADRSEPSRIILATGRNVKEASGTVRISMGRGNTEDSVKELGRALLGHICN